MSVRETLSRSGSTSVEDTQRLDVMRAGDDERTRQIDTDTATERRFGSDRDTERTRPLPAADPDEARAERERRRRERDQALGTRRRSEELDDAPSATAVKPGRTTDKFLGSTGLLLLRLVTAGIIGLHGYAKMMDISGVQQMLDNTIIPEPVIMSYVLAGSEIAIALGLIFGLCTRLAGLGLAAIGIGALVFVKWVSNPFTGNALSGELELLLGAVGLLFLCVGSGGAGLDAAMRRRRAASKS